MAAIKIENSFPREFLFFPHSIIGGETLTGAIPSTCEDTQSCIAVFRALGSAEELAHTDGVKNGAEWTFTAATDGWAPAQGVVYWEIWETLSGDYKTMRARGKIDFVPSIQSFGAAYDPRSVAEKIVSMLEKAMAGTADASVKSYQINNRRIDRYSTAELLDLLKYWRKRVAEEAAKQRGRPNDIKFSL